MAVSAKVMNGGLIPAMLLQYLQRVGRRGAYSTASCARFLPGEYRLTYGAHVPGFARAAMAI